MTAAKRIELLGIPTLAVLGALAAPWLPSALTLGGVALVASSTLLAQSLLRDLWLLHDLRRRDAFHPGERRPCMCVESTVGASGVLIGLLLVTAFQTREIGLGALGWGTLLFATTAFGFAIRDVVFEWNPWRVRIDPDHLNVVPTWRRR